MALNRAIFIGYFEKHLLAEYAPELVLRALIIDLLVFAGTLLGTALVILTLPLLLVGSLHIALIKEDEVNA